MKHRKILAVLLLVLAASGFLPAQDKIVRNVRVAVLPLWFAEDDGTGPIVSDAVQTSIQWTLRFIEGYILVESKHYPKGQSEIAQFASSNGLDNVIYGRVDNINGRYSVSLLLLDVKKDRVEVMEQGSVKRSIEIFDLADTLSIVLLEKFIGRKLEFGRVELNPRGDGPGTTRLFINGTLFGDNVTEIPKFLSGDYDFRIERQNGRDRLTVFDQSVTIKANTDNRFDYPMERYGYVDWHRAHTDPRGEYILDGRPIPPPAGYRMPLTMGTHTLIRKSEGSETYRTRFTVTEGETTGVLVNPNQPGGALSVTFEGNGKTEILIDGLPARNTSPAGTLAAGEHLLEVRQLFGSETVAVYRTIIRIPTKANKTRTVTVTLYADPETATAASLKLRKPPWPPPRTTLSAEVQTLGSAAIWAGGRYLTLDRQLGFSLLAGFSQLERGDPILAAEAKAHWIFLERWGFEPYAGLAALMFTDFGAGNTISDWQGGVYTDPQFYIGPQAGISWNPRLPVVDSVYTEIMFCIPLDERAAPGLRWTLGLRLF